ncbi:hypothetical protein A3F00_02515 [Candidatus Daviesbacteria bacterium RIFCSPHIGHO2_12_FULL_37_11]|uniref:PDZ domain-containing protein n=1 Tax=Candidatus Daviesbacteria bacterium RIFCSPHIGHO2_12_FULL_37_11 TaxID=1797777 RepID=A0A1F5KEK8_9BACT|nr:MAG: hypothetical protein A2111_00025 [Candidatus Daviesbacteria bacterium GWA1_38_6]OGE16197.1 MAG: hypothetical protein A2769_03860 [Candidatus Daviesbacteria bacterium RIFCSPHIGHO2_01_FULL_37_27]OGE39308.1 MAG: hypothetical protein A3F00_02515 [Candidatus Daviesbacteria bacterium RIFCSPHIGHO2_12_FULL_37_11]OGE44765.1 MAG: hypothetical protein A3B39_05395 [Candidatus Daviesbacteria bacterium RIFCSPLOWO2_01_FULL_37_10]
MKDLLKRLNASAILIAVLTFVLGWQLGQKEIDLRWKNYRPALKVENKLPPESVNIDFQLFWDTWDLVSKKYLIKKDVDSEKLFYGAISGMVAALGDPYTVFLPPDQQKSSKEELNGSFEGVGIQLGFNKEKRLVVIAPLEGTPAEKAGIQPEDIIVKIDSKDTLNISLPEAVRLIRGPKNTEVILTIYREGDTNTREVRLKRETIIVKSVSLKVEQSKQGRKVAVIKLSRFGERTQDEWNDAVSNLLSDGVQAVVLDLRNNPGGFLDGAVFIASEFLSSGDVVLQENYQGQRNSYKVNRSGKILKLPLVVLINKGSASASEIVAGAIQDRKRGKLVGEKSFGKGTIQEAEDLPGGSGIHITTAKWLTPSGKWVNETEGLEPDIKVEIPKDREVKEGEIKNDIQLEKALEILE